MGRYAHGHAHGRLAMAVETTQGLRDQVHTRMPDGPVYIFDFRFVLVTSGICTSNVRVGGPG